MKLDKSTIALIAGCVAAAFGGGNMVGGASAESVDAIRADVSEIKSAVVEVRRDVAHIRERIARTETKLDQQRIADRGE